MAKEEEYKKILKGTVKEGKKEIKELERPDYQKIKEIEEGRKDRKTLKRWLDRRIEKPEEGEEEVEEEKEEKVEEKEKKKEKPKEKIEVIPEEKEVERKEKPRFLREEFSKRGDLEDKWRRPRGGDSKKRLEKRGKGKVPKIGYKNSEEERGLVKGLKPNRVSNPSQLEEVSQEEGVIISSKVGRKKRNKIIEKANELEIPILNPRKGELAE